jgi:hypothetical protein
LEPVEPVLEPVEPVLEPVEPVLEPVEPVLEPESPDPDLLLDPDEVIVRNDIVLFLHGWVFYDDHFWP